MKAFVLVLAAVITMLASDRSGASDAAAADDPKASSSLDASSKLSASVFEQHALTHDGDPQRGRELFNHTLTKCADCHKVNGGGGDAGPDLTHIGGKFGRPHLIESLLEPSRQIVEGFRTTLIQTRDGRVETGIVKEQSDQGITYIDANGQRRELAAADIEQRKDSSVSLMPLGLTDVVTPTQFTDLVAYLETLRSGGKPTPGAGITGPSSCPRASSCARWPPALRAARPSKWQPTAESSSANRPACCAWFAMESSWTRRC